MDKVLFFDGKSIRQVVLCVNIFDESYKFSI
jgi:hypothetical protein